MAKRIEVSDLNIYYGNFLAVEGVNVSIEPRSITALIGPSGCGKSTFLRSLNRMHEVIPGARVEGKVVMDGVDLYGADSDPVDVRRQIGMVFQRPNPFPTMSIYDNVAAGMRLNSKKMKKADLDDLVERSLRGANLWNEVKDRLNRPGSGLSGGQQQRLCIARVIGETAPLLVTLGITNGTNLDPFDGRMATLPVFAYYQLTQPGVPPQFAIDRAWTAALLLIILVMGLNLLARLISRFFAPKTR